MGLDPCQPIIDEIDGLKNDIANLQAVLDRDFPPLTQKQREEAKQQLQAAQDKLAKKEIELSQCRQQNPDGPGPKPSPLQLNLDACKVATELFSVANVKCFGAIGKEVHNRGWISANSNQLKLDAPAQGETPLRTWLRVLEL